MVSAKVDAPVTGREPLVPPVAGEELSDGDGVGEVDALGVTDFVGSGVGALDGTVSVGYAKFTAPRSLGSGSGSDRAANVSVAPEPRWADVPLPALLSASF